MRLLQRSWRRLRWNYYSPIFAIALVVMFLATAAFSEITNDDLSPDPVEQTEQIIEVVHEVFDDVPHMIPDVITILDCETGGLSASGGPNGIILHIKPNGQLERNSTTGALGAAQIYSASHSRHFWARQELNEAEILDNIRYTRALIDDRIRRGHNPYADWRASGSCHGHA